MKKLRIATIGIGRFGIFHLHAFRQLEEILNVELVAAAESDVSKHLAIENKFNIPVYNDYLEMIDKENLDAVSVATQDHLHRDAVVNSLSSGLHVFVEKPLDTCTDGSFEMINIAKEKDLLLQVDFHKRYDPYHIEIKKLVNKNKFGDFLYGYCYMEDQIVVPRDWFYDWVSHTSPVWFLGSHFIDLISWLMNCKVKSVFAKGHKNKLLKLGLDTFDSVQSMLTFENNAVVTFDSSWVLPEQFSSIVNQGFRLIGTEGIVEADSQNRGTTSCFTSEQGIRNHNSGFIQLEKGFDGKAKYEGYGIRSIQHFIENIVHLNSGFKLEDLEGTYPSGIDGHEVTKAIEAIHLSTETGEVIDLQKEKDYVNKL
ncbi:MAG: Gfo/Idh/MocA family oxidoreductase [Ignavibacteria bacterium]|jgi:predicted dehydrogenase